MIEDLARLLPLAQDWLWQGFVVFLRVGAMVSIAPGFGERYVPARVKFAIAAAFTLIVVPAMSEQIPRIENASIAVLAPEVLSGLFFGLTLRFFVFALQVAGSISAQSTSLAQIFGGSAGADPQAALGHILVAAGFALAALMGLHVLFAAFILQSYDMVPVGVLISAETTVSLGVAEVGHMFSLGFRMAAPFLIASLIYNVTLGVINRAMPQLMVSFVGAPAITAGSILLLFLSAPLMLSIWYEAMQGFVIAPFGSFR
jgi:flagellar biosynthetic protein FliR